MKTVTPNDVARMFRGSAKAGPYPDEANVYQHEILMIEERNWRRLKSAIHGVFPHLLESERPTQAKTYWHRPAQLIAHDARVAWQEAGRGNISINKDSPLVRFVISAMAARGIGPAIRPPSTVASVLRRKR